jgi:glycosyltransferase involved in cell wall biosynthesis
VKPQVDFWSTGLRGDIVQLPLVESLAQDGRTDQRVVFSSAGPSRAEFDRIGLPYLTTPGNRRLAAAPATVADIVRCRGALRSWYHDRKPIVHVTMASVWDQFYIDVPKRSGAKILLVIHDAQHHIGEESKLLTLLEKRLIRIADHVAVLSSYAGERMRERIGTFRPVHVVSPGLVMDVSKPGPAKQTPSGRPIKFLFFGRIHDYKGLDFVLDAWRSIKSSAQMPMQLTIAGSGDISKYLPDINALPDVELIHGWISDEQMQRVFADHDVNLLPYREGSSSATSLAGMWAGMPAIATPIGGFKEQLYHDVNALIMEDISAQSLTECMLQLASRPELYWRLAQGAHRTAIQLSGPVVADNWYRIYEKILSRPNADDAVL